MVLIDIETTNEGSLTVNRDQITAIQQSGRDVRFWIGDRELFVENISVRDFDGSQGFESPFTGQNYSVGKTWVISPTMVNDARVGYYRRQFTLPSRPWWMCSSSIHFFGVFFNTLVPANQVIGEITNSGAGGSLGAGFDMGIGNTGLKFFSEARYHYVDTGRIPTRMVPVTFGIRW